MIVNTLNCIIRIPLSKEKSKRKARQNLMRFSLHYLGQIVDEFRTLDWKKIDAELRLFCKSEAIYNS